MFTREFLLVCVLCVVANAQTAKLPSRFELCYTNTPNAQECFQRVFQQSFTLLKDGLPELDVLPIDPLEVKTITMSQGDGTVGLTLTMTNVVVTGFKDVQVVSASNEIGETSRVNMRSEVIVPNIQILADYVIGGRILILPIKGEGRCNFTLSNVKVTSRLENEVVTSNGEEYIKVNKFGINTNPEQFYMNLDGLFGGDPRLGEEMNKFLNMNAQTVYKELKPSIENAFGEVFKEVSNKIFLKVPYKSIFLRN